MAIILVSNLTEVLQYVGTVGVTHGLWLAVYRGQLLVRDQVVLHCLPECLRRVPVEDAKVGLKVWEPEVDGAGGEDVVTLQQTTAELRHEGEAVEVLEVDVRHVARAELLAERRQSHPGTAPAVVSPVRQAAEHLAVPGGADHHVGQLDWPDAVGVTELVQAPEQQQDVNWAVSTDYQTFSMEREH